MLVPEQKLANIYWVVCSTLHALSPDAPSPRTLSPRALSPRGLRPSGLRHILKKQASRVEFFMGVN